MFAARHSFTFALAGWAVASSWNVRAQVAGRRYRVGTLSIGVPNNARVVADDVAFEAELARLGFVKGIDLIIDERFAASDVSRLDALALELVATNPDILLSARGTPARWPSRRQRRRS